MITVTALRNGMTIKMDGDMYVVTDFKHITPGNWRGYVQTSLRSLRTGKITKQRFRSTDSVEEVAFEPKKVQFLYVDGENFNFMDLEDYNTVAVAKEVVAEAAPYLTEGLEVTAQFHEGKVLTLDLPTQVKLKVVETVPGVRGDSVSTNTKPATLETGLVIQVPLFVDVGQEVQVDTRTGQYLGRA